ncbi:MAG: Panacea domain-containing protein [Candidatus Angelobacter sp.]
MKQSEAKLRELIIHVATLSGMDEPFGATKLNKILFNADFEAYRQWGKSISGQEYFALEWGPAPRIMKRVISDMERKRELAIEPKEYYGEKQDRPVALRGANLDIFSKEELNLVIMVINKHWGKSATKMSNESHEFLGWAVAKLEETIPYEVALVGTRGPTLDEIRYGEGLQAMAEECLARNATRKAPDHHRGA